MAAGKRLAGFAVTAAVLVVLLVMFSTPYLFWMLVVLAALALAMGALLGRDAGAMHLALKVSPGGQVGRPLTVTLTAEQPRRFLAARCADVTVEVKSVMFGSVERHTLRLPLQGGGASLSAPLSAALCGEMTVSCTRVAVTDLMELFSLRCSCPPAVRTVLYPQPMNLELTLSQAPVGEASVDGLMQNRRGSDPSEIFDVREYVPGDDIRTIHWKLSSKTDTLIVRQASDPSHYDVALLPDLGLFQEERSVSQEELNSAAAAAVALGEGLLRLGTVFCLLIPSKQGIEVCEVRSVRQLHRLLPRWLGVEVCRQSGTGLTCFLSEHMEQYFTRLLVVSAGKYAQDVSGLDRRIGVTVVSTSGEEESVLHTALSSTCEMVVLPAKPRRGEVFRIAC